MKSLKPWVYKKILDIVDLDVKTANEKNIEITSIQITEELYIKISQYLSANKLTTHLRHGPGGRFEGGNYYIYSCYFSLAHIRQDPAKYYIYSGGAVGYVPKGILKKNYLENRKNMEKITPNMLQLFYGILKKYPSHILNVNWSYNTKQSYATMSGISQTYK